jgi:hypothetical protein
MSAPGRRLFPDWEYDLWECHLALPRPRPSRSCQLRYGAARAARRPRKPRQAPPFPASRSRRRSKKPGRHKGRSERQALVQLAVEDWPGRRIKQWEGHRQRRKGLSWRSLQGSRERPSVATMVASPASHAARTPGSDAVNPWDIIRFSQGPAKTRSLTETTCNALKPKCSWAGTETDRGGTAPACWLGENFGSPPRIETGSAFRAGDDFWEYAL